MSRTYADLPNVWVQRPEPNPPPGPACVACGHRREEHAKPRDFWDGECSHGCDCPGGYLPDPTDPWWDR